MSCPRKCLTRQDQKKNCRNLNILVTIQQQINNVIIKRQVFDFEKYFEDTLLSDLSGRSHSYCPLCPPQDATCRHAACQGKHKNVPLSPVAGCLLHTTLFPVLQWLSCKS